MRVTLTGFQTLSALKPYPKFLTNSHEMFLWNIYRESADNSTYQMFLRNMNASLIDIKSHPCSVRNILLVAK